jgi:hypothetical protein
MSSDDAGPVCAFPGLISAMVFAVLCQFAKGDPIADMDRVNPIDYNNPKYIRQELADNAVPGTVYEVTTNHSHPVEVWKPDAGAQYWCHGFTFGGYNNTNGPYSLEPDSVPTVLEDEYSWIPSYMAAPGDTVIFFDHKGLVQHSGVVVRMAFQARPGLGEIDQGATLIDSMWGLVSQNTSTLRANEKEYSGDHGGYAFYKRGRPLQQCGFGRGADEKIPPFEARIPPKTVLPYGSLGPPIPAGFKVPKPVPPTRRKGGADRSRAVPLPPRPLAHPSRKPKIT